ncbi:MAG: protein kinase [Acidobacteriaceae bacterium]|nr:protein kinase [Acidobacteriaceae bacterium]
MGAQQPIDRLEAANEIFSEALELPAAARETFVRAKCESDPDLAASVLRLLSQVDRLGSFLERSPVSRAMEGEFRMGDVVAGRFRILGEARKGGMGAVYPAEDTALRERIALKTLRSGPRSDGEALARFRDEIKLARRIVHPNVCRIYDLFTGEAAYGEVVFFTMEWLEGETLGERMAGRPMTPEHALTVTKELAEGLDAAHRLGIAHRDLKPSNVILARGADGAERVVITDFGLAKMFDAREADASGNTAPGQIMGSLDYMAPEQFLGEPVSPATDIFALGAIAYEMLTGRKPFPNETLLRTALRRVSGAPIPARHYTPDVPEGWQRAIARAMSREPQNRQQSAKALVEEMEQGGGVRRRARPISRRKLIVGGVAVSGLSSFLGYLRFKEWKGQIPLKPVVMLTATTYSANEADLGAAARAADVFLRASLDQSAHLRLASGDQIGREWRLITGKAASSQVPNWFSPEVAREIALRIPAQFVAFSNVAQVGDERVLRVRLELLGDSAAQAKRGWSNDFEMQGRREIAESAYEAASWIRRTTGESAENVERKMRRPEELTTSSWEALKEFTEANEAWQNGQAGPAILHLKTALAIDDQFALASARLADILKANGQADDAYREWARAVSLLEKKNFTDRESLRTRGLFALDVGLNAAAVDVFSRYILEYPDDPLPKYYKAAALNRLGRAEEALQSYSSAIRLAPDNYAFAMGRAIVYLEQGRIEQASRDWQRASGLNARDWTDQVAMAMAFARADIGEVQRRIAQVRKSGSSEFQSKSYAFEACLRGEQGRWQEAAAALQAGIEFDRRVGTPMAARHIKQRLLAELHLAQGSAARARCLCAEVLNDGPGYETRLQVACLLARCGDVAGARAQQCATASTVQACGDGQARYARNARRPSCQPLVLPDWPIYAYQLHSLGAEIALAEGRTAQAADEMEKAGPPPSMHVFSERLLRVALASRNNAAKQRLASLLTGSPGRWWIEPELNSAGFFSRAVEQLGPGARSSQVSAIMAGLRA